MDGFGITHRFLIWVALSLSIFCPAARSESTRESAFRYSAEHYKGGELRIVHQLPVLIVSGSPEEIGEQIGALALRPAQRLKQIPYDLAKLQHTEHLFPILLQVGKVMLPQFLDDYRKEMAAMSKSGDMDIDLLTVVNTIDDLDRIGGCSSITIEPAHSATGGMLMARNLDYSPIPEDVPNYTLITVYHPRGKLSFASVGFPGWLGVLSGMNEAGLTLATHDVKQSADHSPAFTPIGTPMTLSFRRVLEECRTVAEAERLMKSVKRTTYLSIAVADKQNCAILELTPKSVVVRRPENGMLLCTNHFRSPELRVDTNCQRYANLSAGGLTGKVDLTQIWQRLHKASWGGTFQSMVFEPSLLKLHLAYGTPPATSQTPRMVDLADLLKKPQ
jgi:isopenicillin-N N-acyltransferase-like protein